MMKAQISCYSKSFALWAAASWDRTLVLTLSGGDAIPRIFNQIYILIQYPIEARGSRSCGKLAADGGKIYMSLPVPVRFDRRWRGPCMPGRLAVPWCAFVSLAVANLACCHESARFR